MINLVYILIVIILIFTIFISLNAITKIRKERINNDNDLENSKKKILKKKRSMN